jgi:hypothetical protein
MSSTITGLTPLERTALSTIQRRIGEGNASKGFHRRSEKVLVDVERWDCTNHPGCVAQRENAIEALRDHAVATIALIDTETSEAIEEVRSGRALTETWYSINDKEVVPAGPEHDGADWVTLASPERTYTGVPAKPEGVPAEIADAVIRAFDFAARFGIDLAGAIDEKLQYNATRARMHGKTM